MRSCVVSPPRSEGQMSIVGSRPGVPSMLCGVLISPASMRSATRSSNRRVVTIILYISFRTDTGTIEKDSAESTVRFRLTCHTDTQSQRITTKCPPRYIQPSICKLCREPENSSSFAMIIGRTAIDSPLGRFGIPFFRASFSALDEVTVLDRPTDRPTREEPCQHR